MSLTNELAKERTWLAADRTLMAWIRTSLALIGVGFAIAQTYEYLESGYADTSVAFDDSLRAPLVFGVSFMVLGMLCTLAGAVQYRKVVERIRNDDYRYRALQPLPLLIALLLLIIAAFGLIALL